MSMQLSAKEMKRIRNALLTDKTLFDNLKDNQESSALSNLINKIAPYIGEVTIKKAVSDSSETSKE